VQQEASQDGLPVQFHIQVGIVCDNPAPVLSGHFSKLCPQIPSDSLDITIQTYQTLTQRIDQTIIRSSRVAVSFSVASAIDTQLRPAFVEKLPRKLRHMLQHTMRTCLCIQQLLRVG